MAASRLEEMTVGELSARVKTMNGEEDRILEKQRRKIIDETTAKILPFVRAPIYVAEHPFYEAKLGGCIRCHYPKDHPVHA